MTKSLFVRRGHAVIRRLRAYATQSELSSLVWAASNTAEFLGTCLSLDEVSNYFLAGMRVSPEELRKHVSEDPFLQDRLRVEDGFLVRRGREDLLERRQRQIRASARNKRLAKQRGWILTQVSPFLEMLAITGSTAYHSADPWEDIDLFVFAERRRLWITMLFSLATLRMRDTLIRSEPKTTLSVAFSVDERGFDRLSSDKQNLLFARELLAAEVLYGEETYRGLLRENEWMAEVLPGIYSERTDDADRKGHDSPGPGLMAKLITGPILDVLEVFAYGLVSLYVRAKAIVHNSRQRGDPHKGTFSVSATPYWCFFETTKYRELEDVWAQITPTSVGDEAA